MLNDWGNDWVHLVHVHACPEEPHAEDCHEAETPGQAIKTNPRLAHQVFHIEAALALFFNCPVSLLTLGWLLMLIYPW